MPGGQVVRRLTLDEEILGSNPSRAAIKKNGPWSVLFNGSAQLVGENRTLKG